jgi:hypothetical protein
MGSRDIESFGDESTRRLVPSKCISIAGFSLMKRATSVPNRNESSAVGHLARMMPVRLRAHLSHLFGGFRLDQHRSAAIAISQLRASPSNTRQAGHREYSI